MATTDIIHRVVLFMLSMMVACGGRVLSEPNDSPPDSSLNDSSIQDEVVADRDAATTMDHATFWDGKEDLPSDAIEDSPWEYNTDGPNIYECKHAPQKCLDPGDVCLANWEPTCLDIFCDCKPDMHWKCGNTQDVTCPLLPCLLPFPGSSCAEFNPGDKCVWLTMYCECTSDKSWHCGVF